MARGREKAIQRVIAGERMVCLLELSREYVVKEADLAQSMVFDARKIGKKVNVRIPREYKQFFCRGCGRVFSSGDFRVRLNPKHKRRMIHCLSCGRIGYWPY